ncbi:hypothetical protein [Actinomadura sp. HBU206391]|uniref:hypothetical protein n=1 Tax=Actinomadura sp. HBU206391 TaxID=2731692 RepID=UPI00164F7559|nr:hypothetical protein [Actinomadura sp. HBU206391]MBC6459203.1 hypothetical protein [Actinomadura sp. HBU206391]
MPLGRDEIRARLEAANALDPLDGGPGGEVYVEAMRDIVPHAEALGDPALIFRARLSFAWALRYKPLTKGSSDFFGEAVPVLRRCLLMWHEQPHRIPEDDVRAMWNQLFLIVDAYVWLYPAPAPRIHRLLDELEKHCPPTRRSTRYAIDHYRMCVEARRGDLDAVERLWGRLRAQGEPEDHFHSDGMATKGATMWQRLGRNDRAVEALAPLVAGQIPTGERQEHADDLVMPYLRAGRLEEAVAAHQRTYARPGMKLEDVAGHLEFCARTGNEERGLDVLRRNLHYFEQDVASVELMWTATAAALLCHRVMQKDLDTEWIWPCDCDDPECDADVVWSYADLGSLLRWQAVNFSHRVDELNGTSFQSEKITELLHAEPIALDLPLPPDTAEPRHRAAPPPATHLASATADDLRDGLCAARTLERPKAKSIRMQLLLQNAIAQEQPETALEIRLALLEELGSWERARRYRLFTTLVEIARLHDARPSLLGADRLDRMWAAVPVTLDRVLTHPTVHAAQIRGLLRTLEPHCRPGTEDAHHLRWFRVELEVRRGDVDAARAAWAAFGDLPPTQAFTTRPNILRRTRWWLDLGRDDEAVESMAPLLEAARPGDVLSEDRKDYLLLPYLRAGRLDEAREIHERTYRTVQGAPEVAAHLEFCARAGEPDHGREIVQRNLDLFHSSRDDHECSIDRVRAYAAAMRMSERIVADGLDETWTWPADECCPPEDGWSYARFAASCRFENELFITRWDELMGTTATRTLVAGFDHP